MPPSAGDQRELPRPIAVALSVAIGSALGAIPGLATLLLLGVFARGSAVTGKVPFPLLPVLAAVTVFLGGAALCSRLLYRRIRGGSRS
ncbi:MAG TPA: hypothetical protein VK348_05585 [Planctomycetota bacterium]|nr:hypothetical protein [Planctomycetota bacterium]